MLHKIQQRFKAARDLRRGICMLNAGRFDEAVDSFQRAREGGCTDRSLPSYLAACYFAIDKPEGAADQLASENSKTPSRNEERIRAALALWTAGRQDEAIASLREAVHEDPECAELHFQLGVLLASLEQFDEAELRFIQALNVDSNHTDALVHLGLCCAARGAAGEALRRLQRAQAHRPNDARIGLLLAQAAKAVNQQGHRAGVHATMPDETEDNDPHGLEELARIVEGDGDYVDAFLSLPASAVDRRVFSVLLQTLHLALKRCPNRAGLHLQCGRVLERLGRVDEAITANERAVAIDPRATRALIELGRLYQLTNRADDAASRLEQAVAAGAEYADVYYLLGNLYRDRGEVVRARTAYRRALAINTDFAAAREALTILPA